MTAISASGSRVGKGMQVGVLLDRKADDDYVVEHEGAKVLMVDPELFPLVDGATLDTDRNGPVESLVITRGEQQPTKKGAMTPFALGGIKGLAYESQSLSSADPSFLKRGDIGGRVVNNTGGLSNER